MSVAGTIVYEIGKNGNLRGHWTHPDPHGCLGTEIGSGGMPSRIPGKYQVVIYSPAGVEIYRGNLTIRQKGDVFFLEWLGQQLVPNPQPVTYSGVGLRIDEGHLAACFQEK